MGGMFMITNIEELKEGDIFAYKFMDIKHFKLDTLVSNSIYINPIDSIDYKNDNLKGTMLLFKYLGDNICEEFYSGYRFQMFDSLSSEPYYTYEDNVEEFMQKYHHCLEYPLVLNILENEMHIINFDEQTKKRIGNNEGMEDEIRTALEYYYKGNKKRLEASMDILVSIDRKVAYTENMIFDFQKRKIRK